MSTRVLTGLDVLIAEGFRRLRGRRLAVLAHPASVDRDLIHILDHLLGHGMDVRVLLGPEHGFSGHAQDMIPIEAGARGALSVFSLYGQTEQSLRPPDESLTDCDALVVDLQDVGTRYYTFAVTMRYCLEACARLGRPVIVLDRPNPLGGVLREGPVLEDACRSFVGGFGVPVRHGLTLGELARLAVREGVGVDLEVVAVQGFERGHWFDETGLPWVLPSPNMPTLATATVYPGGCLLEATNLSEGRGTTRPFELVGAPWLDGRRLALDLNRAGLTGVGFRPCNFQPTFHKHRGQICEGVQIHITDRATFEPFLCGALLLQAARRQDPGQFALRADAYEFVANRPALDLLAGGSALREALLADLDVRDLAPAWRRAAAAFGEEARAWLMY